MEAATIMASTATTMEATIVDMVAETEVDSDETIKTSRLKPKFLVRHFSPVFFLLFLPYPLVAPDVLAFGGLLIICILFPLNISLNGSSQCILMRFLVPVQFCCNIFKVSTLIISSRLGSNAGCITDVF